MNRSDAISYSCGLAPEHTDEFPTNFFPVLAKKYITVSNPPKGSSINYPYLEDSLRMVIPLLKREGIDVFQVGPADNDANQIGTKLLGQTDLRQTAYLIKNAELHIGGDDLFAHFAAVYGTPLVQFFGGFPRRSHGPAVVCEDKYVGIDPEYSASPSYSFNTSFESRSILPERVAEGIAKLIDKDFKIPFKTQYIGEEYGLLSYDVVPNFALSPNELREIFLTIRMDYEFNEDMLRYALNSRTCNVVTDKPISAHILDSYHSSINWISYIVNDEPDKDFIQKIISKGLRYNVITSKEGEDLDKVKFDLFEFKPLIPHTKRGKKDVPTAGEMTAQTRVKAAKTILDKDGSYHTKYHWKNRLTINDPKGNIIGDAIDQEYDLWEEASYLYFYENGESLSNQE